MKSKNLVPPFPETLVLDPSGDATTKLNSKRPNETMFFSANGKLASQARGSLSWPDGAAEYLAKARARRGDRVAATSSARRARAGGGSADAWSETYFQTPSFSAATAQNVPVSVVGAPPAFGTVVIFHAPQPVEMLPADL